MTANYYCRISYLLALFLLFPGAAFAYVDFGSGSIAAQAAIAGGLGALFWVKMYWRRIVRFTKRMISKK